MNIRKMNEREIKDVAFYIFYFFSPYFCDFVVFSVLLINVQLKTSLNV